MTTTDQTRSDLLAALADLSRAEPNLRFGQMLCNVAMMAGRMDEEGVWNVEDFEALAATRSMVQGAVARSAAA